MNNYGFDYMDYLTSVPNNMNYKPLPKGSSKINTLPNINPTTKTSTPQLLDATQGWLRGNIFANLYDPYKNYKSINLNPKNEKEALLYQVMQYKFALIELNLYLDTHPNDTDLIKLYNQYLDIEKQMCDKYESLYGPLTLDSKYLNKNTWVWENSPWPWEAM